MPKYGFRRNSKAISEILKTVDGGKRAAAQKILDQLDPDVREESHLTEYVTDREVIGVVVRADSQARHGVATRAANQARKS